MAIKGEGGEQLNEVLEQIEQNEPRTCLARAHYLIMFARTVYEYVTGQSPSNDVVFGRDLPEIVIRRIKGSAALDHGKLELLLDGPVIPSELDRLVEAHHTVYGTWAANLALHICWATIRAFDASGSEVFTRYINPSDPPRLLNGAEIISLQKSQFGRYCTAYRSLQLSKGTLSELKKKHESYPRFIAFLEILEKYYLKPADNPYAHIMQRHLLDHINETFKTGAI